MNDYERELNLLNLKLNEMFSLSIESFKSAIRSFEENDLELARRVISNDDDVDNLKREVEEAAYTMLEKFCPKGVTLRKIVMSIKVAGDLERIADQAVNISQVTEYMRGRKLLKTLIDVPRMAQIAERMAKNAMMAYFGENVELAKKTWLSDDAVDELDNRIVEEVKTVILANNTEEAVSQAERLILLSRSIERVADHATNICEETVYMVSGKKIQELL